MDLSTVVGLILGVLIMATAIVLGGSPLSIFIDVSSVMCVLGGAICATLVCYPVKTVLLLPKILSKTIFNRSPDVDKIIEELIDLAGVARRDGLLALDHRLSEVSHPFMRLGMQMAIDGTKPQAIEDILRAEIDAVAKRHALGKGVIDQIGKYAPAFGMIGTMLGLVMMLNNMTDPSSIGSGMAVALLTTLYGAVLANLVCLPASEKLAYYNREEIQALELIVKGVLAIQSGEHPRIVEQKLSVALHPKHRKYDLAA